MAQVLLEKEHVEDLILTCVRSLGARARITFEMLLISS